MNACVLHKIGDLRVESIARPAPGVGEVLVRVGCCGVCGSDIPRVFTKGTYRFPLIPGHEFAGTVESLGYGVDADWLDARVAVFPLIPCKACEACALGEYQLCERYDYLGSRRDGAFAEYVCAPVWNLQRVPEGVLLEEAAMTEPAAVALHALRRASFVAGEQVVVFGAGPIGLLCGLWSKALGAASVCMVDIDPSRAVLVDTLGIGSFQGVTKESATELADRYTLAIEASGSAAALADAIRACRRQGRVVLLGNPNGDMKIPAASYSAAMRKELALIGTWNSAYGEGERNDWAKTIEFIAAKRLNIRPLITQRVTLHELPAALSMLRDRSQSATKVMCIP